MSIIFLQIMWVMCLTNEINIKIWGREFLLPVRFDCYFDEKVTKQQKEAIELIFKNQDWIEGSKETVKKYCKEKVKADDAIKNKENLFCFVMPEYFFVKRDEDRIYSRVSLMLKYKYDIGHGLAIVFDNKGNVEIMSQDDIL